MYTSTITLNGRKLKGTLDFYVLKKSQQELTKIGLNLRIEQILSELLEGNVVVMSTVFIQSITRLTDVEPEELLELKTKHFKFKNNDEWLKQCFDEWFSYFENLCLACLPKNEKKAESEFEDFPISDSEDDFDFAQLEYTWTHVLKRDGFWGITLKNFVEQIDIYKRQNQQKTEEIEEL